MKRLSKTTESPDPRSKSSKVRQLAERATDELASQLAGGNSESLDAYLSAMGRFHRYSFGNIMLILAQCPDATRVAGFTRWKSLGRHVKKGEKGIAIFAPMRLKRKEPDAGGLEDDPVVQVRFRVVHVFDVGQTEGDPLPELSLTSGDPGAHLDRLESAIVADGITLETTPDLGGAEGRSSGGAIAVREGLAAAERFSVLVHEWAHERLHKVDADSRPPKVVRETEAEAVAFVVNQAIGLVTGSASADYIRLYQGDAETLAKSLDRIQRMACEIIDAITEPADMDHGQAVEVTASSVHRRQRQR